MADNKDAATAAAAQAVVPADPAVWLRRSAAKRSNNSGSSNNNPRTPQKKNKKNRRNNNNNNQQMSTTRMMNISGGVTNLNNNNRANALLRRRRRRQISKFQQWKVGTEDRVIAIRRYIIASIQRNSNDKEEHEDGIDINLSYNNQAVPHPNPQQTKFPPGCLVCYYPSLSSMVQTVSMSVSVSAVVCNVTQTTTLDGDVYYDLVDESNVQYCNISQSLLEFQVNCPVYVLHAGKWHEGVVKSCSRMPGDGPNGTGNKYGYCVALLDAGPVPHRRVETVQLYMRYHTCVYSQQVVAVAVPNNSCATTTVLRGGCSSVCASASTSSPVLKRVKVRYDEHNATSDVRVKAPKYRRMKNDNVSKNTDSDECPVADVVNVELSSSSSSSSPNHCVSYAEKSNVASNYASSAHCYAPSVTAECSSIDRVELYRGTVRSPFFMASADLHILGGFASKDSKNKMVRKIRFRSSDDHDITYVVGSIPSIAARINSCGGYGGVVTVSDPQERNSLENWMKLLYSDQKFAVSIIESDSSKTLVVYFPYPCCPISSSLLQQMGKEKAFADINFSGVIYFCDFETFKAELTQFVSTYRINEFNALINDVLGDGEQSLPPPQANMKSEELPSNGSQVPSAQNGEASQLVKERECISNCRNAEPQVAAFTTYFNLPHWIDVGTMKRILEDDSLRRTSALWIRSGFYVHISTQVTSRPHFSIRGPVTKINTVFSSFKSTIISSLNDPTIRFALSEFWRRESFAFQRKLNVPYLRKNGETLVVSSKQVIMLFCRSANFRLDNCMKKYKTSCVKLSQCCNFVTVEGHVESEVAELAKLFRQRLDGVFSSLKGLVDD